MQFKCLKEVSDYAGRLLILLIEIQGQRFLLTNFVAPNVFDIAFFAQLDHLLSEMGNYPTVVGGDFNQVMGNITDHSTPFSTCIQVPGLCYRTFAIHLVWWTFGVSVTHQQDYTFYSSPHSVLSRIDYFLVSKTSVSSVNSSTIGNILLSDHAPVFLHMVPPCNLYRSSSWRLNSSLLDLEFVSSLKAEIYLYLDTNWESAPSAGVAWEDFKAFIRGHIIQYASFKKKSNKAKQCDLEKEFAISETAFKWDTNSANLSSLVKLKYEVNPILTQKAEFTLFCLRHKQFEEGDKAGKMLARYIKMKKFKALYLLLRRRMVGWSLTQMTSITFRSFYILLYSSEMQAGSHKISAFLSSLT